MRARLETILSYIFYFPLYLYFRCNGAQINTEATIWYNILPVKKKKYDFQKAFWLLSNLDEFITLMYYRTKTWKYNPIKLIYKGTPNLYIPLSQKIGERLVIQHGFGTIFNCEYMGNDCQVWHGVTLGKARSGINQGRPRIGNNVKICCNAIVLGNIEIGDNVIIGAGSVVTKSIPDNCTVVGNPAHIIYRDGKKVNEEL